MKTRNSRLWIAVAVGSAMALTACGSSGGKAPSNAGAPSDATTPATGAEVDIWTAAPVGTAGASAPQRGAGVQAAFDYLNNHGGLGPQHQKVTVKLCNTQLTPQGEIQCGQQAAADPKAIAVVAPIVVIATQPFMSGLEKAGMAVVNPAVSDAAQATSPVSFPLSAENLAPAGCGVMTAQATKLTKIGFAGSSTAVTIGELNDATAAATKAGLTPVGPVTFPITTTDVTPFVTQLNQKNPQATVLVGSPQNVGQWLAAEARLGSSKPLCTIDALTPPQVLIGLGSALKDFYTAASFPDPTWTGYPMLVQFRAQAAAEVASGNKAASLAPTNSGVEVLGGWMGAQAVIQAAAKTTGALTKATLLDALNHATINYGTGSGALIPPVDFSKPNPNPKYPRVFNTTMFLKHWDPSKQTFVRVTSVPSTDVASLIP